MLIQRSVQSSIPITDSEIGVVERPDDIVETEKVFVITAFRNREENKKKFLPEMHQFLSKQVKHTFGCLGGWFDAKYLAEIHS